jgi:hypothetical protein
LGAANVNAMSDMNLVLKAGLMAANDLFSSAGFRRYDVALNAILLPDVVKNYFDQTLEILIHCKMALAEK